LACHFHRAHGDCRHDSPRAGQRRRKAQTRRISKNSCCFLGRAGRVADAQSALNQEKINERKASVANTEEKEQSDSETEDVETDGEEEKFACKINNQKENLQAGENAIA
jgi:hypothetical protein